MPKSIRPITPIKRVKYDLSRHGREFELPQSDLYSETLPPAVKISIGLPNIPQLPYKYGLLAPKTK